MVKRLTLFSLILALLMTWTLPVTADKLSEAKQSKNKIQSEISKIQSQKNEVKAEKAKLETTKNELLNTAAQEKQQYEQLVAEVQAIEADIKQIEDAVKESEENYNQQKELLKTRLRVMYENSNNSILETLLRSKSLTDFMEKLEIISLISKKDKQLVEDLKVAQMDVEYKRQLREEDKMAMLDKVDSKKERINELKASRAGIEERLKKSQAELKKLEDREDDLLRESKEMDSIIKSLSKKTKYTKYIGGNMTWPVPSSGRITSPFGMRRHPILKKMKMHTGIDIDADKGDSIVAAGKGTVIIAKYQNGYGNTVVIDHGGGISTLYAHCSKLLVKVGDEVKAGQVIAKVGSTGLSTGPHLHFEVRKDGKPRNPLQDVNK